MNPREWFALCLRLMGLWYAFQGIEGTVTIFNFYRGLYGQPFTQVGPYFTHAFAQFFAASVLLTGATAITNVFYPRPP